MIIYRFLVKFAQKIPTKLAIFYRLLSSKVSPENFHESVFENTAKFEFFCDLSEARSMAQSIRFDSSRCKFGGKVALFMQFGTFFKMKVKQDNMKCLF